MKVQILGFPCSPVYLTIGRKSIEVDMVMLHFMGEQQVDGGFYHAGATAEIDFMILPVAAGGNSGQETVGAGPGGVMHIRKCRGDGDMWILL